jgi:predicted nucleic acid-binding protein
VLALAVATKPDFIVTGDRDLLTLQAYDGFPIIEPVKAIQIIENLQEN